MAAYEYAQAGRRVALISSGDIGVYGMAGPTYEVLLRSGWHPGGDIEVEVIPGITSLSACASLVGAPLTHDFCSISLSDLLTPWPVIAQRLAAAARGDFVIALYNPRSGRRTQHLVEAQRILLRHRQAETPVAIVKSAYREGQAVHLTHLGALAEAQIGMLSTVLIGNASTYVQDGLMVTPRGYAQKYDAITGDPRSGERAGRSLSLGLEGWQAAIHDQLGQIQGGSLAALARDRGVPLGELLQAIGQAGTRAAGGMVDRQAEDTTGLIAAQVRSWRRAGAVAGHPGLGAGPAGDPESGGSDGGMAAGAPRLQPGCGVGRTHLLLEDRFPMLQPGCGWRREWTERLADPGNPRVLPAHRRRAYRPSLVPPPGRSAARGPFPRRGG